jgi:hypothetical protein
MLKFFLLENLFSITTLALKKVILKRGNFLIGEVQFHFGKNSAQTTKA